jgi:hypothetical protein
MRPLRPRRDGILLAAFGAALPEARDGYEVFAAEVAALSESRPT